MVVRRSELEPSNEPTVDRTRSRAYAPLPTSAAVDLLLALNFGLFLDQKVQVMPWNLHRQPPENVLELLTVVALLAGHYIVKRLKWSAPLPVK